MKGRMEKKGGRTKARGGEMDKGDDTVECSFFFSFFFYDRTQRVIGEEARRGETRRR